MDAIDWFVVMALALYALWTIGSALDKILAKLDAILAALGK